MIEIQAQIVDVDEFGFGVWPPVNRENVARSNVRVTGQVCMALQWGAEGEFGEGLDEIFETKNIVTDAGDLYYAQRGANEVPTNFTNASGTFDGVMELYDSATSGAPAKGNDRSALGTVIGVAKIMDSGYPQTNNLDANNTGKGTDVVTYKVSYLVSEVVGSDIDDVIITNPSPGASEALLMHADGLGAFAKSSAQTLIVWINHTFNGT